MGRRRRCTFHLSI
uniref:Uncharacterized protein n=1 Tax=Romanomermis culicivorax TaxID=13658 RepID=A0A915KVE6_ROMCU